MGTVTSEQVHQLLSILSNPITDKLSQISGSTICLADGTTSSPKQQPNLLPHTSSSPPSGTPNPSHFISAGMKNDLTYTHAAWIIDTGASCHVCADLTLFHSTQTISDTVVTLPDGSRIPVTVSGTIILSPKLTLNNVLYISEFKFNLLSISALTWNSTISVLFSSNSCYIFSENPFIGQEHIQDFMIGRGNLQSNLYVLDTHCSSSQFEALSVLQNNPHIWHQRLGHPSFSKLQILSKLLRLPHCKNNHDSLCQVCPLAKQKRMSFPSNPHLSNSLFDLIHLDVWDPFQVPTHEGYKYFFTIVDDCTRVTWVYLLKNKSSVSTVFPQFLRLIHTQYNSNIKAIRSDNAPELAFTDLLQEKGIEHYFSCPYTPQQNSVVERKHQHILNVARALLFSI